MVHIPKLEKWRISSHDGQGQNQGNIIHIENTKGISRLADLAYTYVARMSQ